MSNHKYGRRAQVSRVRCPRIGGRTGAFRQAGGTHHRLYRCWVDDAQLVGAYKRVWTLRVSSRRGVGSRTDAHDVAVSSMEVAHVEVRRPRAVLAQHPPFSELARDGSGIAPQRMEGRKAVQRD